jgi:glycosyltransferase involved in cell wall biosynthesis
MKAAIASKRDDIVVILVGGGELQTEIDSLAKDHPDLFRVLPFQNQSRMPLVYRLGDLFVLPSAHGETWGLGVNEALACGRPVLVSDKVGCAADVVDESCGRVFSWGREGKLLNSLARLLDDPEGLRGMRNAAIVKAWQFDISKTEAALLQGTTLLSSHG